MSFEKLDVLDMCRTYGPLLRLPSALDGSRVMAAFASVESSLGLDCGPRHEPAYDVGGHYAKNSVQAALLAKYGSAAACSYGPWQMMLLNFAACYTPSELETDLRTCAVEFVRHFNLVTQRATTLDEMGEIWNAGHITPDPAYTQKLSAAYDNFLSPELTSAV